jgi:hypothetical protein
LAAALSEASSQPHHQGSLTPQTASRPRQALPGEAQSSPFRKFGTISEINRHVVRK